MPRNRMTLRDRTSVVTGAAGGIGRAIAVSLARRGCHLALADIDEARLAETAKLAVACGVRTSCHRLDVANREAVASFPAVVIGEHGRVDVLVNNAAVALGGTFEQITEADFEKLFAINFWGVVETTRAFLPYLRTSDEARIVNISSLYGLISPPGQTAYSASKFAVRAFSQSLALDLRSSHVGVTLVLPGGVTTAMTAGPSSSGDFSPRAEAQRRAAAGKLSRTSSETAGEIIVQGIEHRKSRVLVGIDAKIASVVERIAPISCWKLLERMNGLRRKAALAANAMRGKNAGRTERSGIRAH